jgi:xanthine dehydrogenase small subunit
MIQFILNNEHIETDEKSGKTLIDFIRENKQLKGTKIGCREGDCGACTVLVGTLTNDKIIYKSITSCISPLGNAHGKHIVTVEGINLENDLNVVQDAIAENFATQCGFCTPGFVVSLTGYALNQCDNDQIDAISGNICRCTGYKSIEKAADLVEEKLTDRRLINLIEKGFVPTYFKDIPEQLRTLKIQHSTFNIHNQTIVANGTDLYVRHADTLSEQHLQLIGNDASLKGIAIKNNTITIGASTTVSEILGHKSFKKLFPNLKKHLKLVSSEPIRNMGTLAGNFVNASPIGDMSIFFLALNSTLNLTDRQLSFQDFHQDYKTYDLKENELIQSISFDLFDENTKFNFEKVSKRTHLDIATVNTACRISTEKNQIKNAYVAIGGVAAIPKFLKQTNQFLIGKHISVSTVIDAEKIMQSEISPIADVRGTKAYKRLLARQLFFAHFVELFPEIITLEKLMSY